MGFFGFFYFLTGVLLVLGFVPGRRSSQYRFGPRRSAHRRPRNPGNDPGMLAPTAINPPPAFMRASISDAGLVIQKLSRPGKKSLKRYTSARRAGTGGATKPETFGRWAVTHILLPALL